MKISTMIGGVKFSFENNDDLIRQLEEEIAKRDKQLAEFNKQLIELAKLKKQRWFMTKAVRQLSGKEEPAEPKIPQTTP